MPAVRLNKVLRELNISIDRAIDFLESKGHQIEKRPTSKISEEIYELLCGEFQSDAENKVASKEVAEAQINLGMMLEKGQGVPQDFEEAIRFLNLTITSALWDNDNQTQIGSMDMYNKS